MDMRGMAARWLRPAPPMALDGRRGRGKGKGPARLPGGAGKGPRLLWGLDLGPQPGDCGGYSREAWSGEGHYVRTERRKEGSNLG